MGHERGPWGDHDDDVDERELVDLPSGAAIWIVIALGAWTVIAVMVAVAWLS
jgi:hypothetical protein